MIQTKSKRSAAEWEDTFRGWAGGPGDTEHARCENAERMVRKALKADSELANLSTRVFSQGSFKNVTNIPQESDVDISACYTGAYYFDLPTKESKTADFFRVQSVQP